MNERRLLPPHFSAAREFSDWQSALLPPGSYYMVKSCQASQHGFNSPVAFLKTNGSSTSFVDDVKRCFRGSAETTEAGRGDYLANAFFA